jgi:O-acetyl-ADP-ribose deacetylase (regulator of RNase III)
MKVVKGDLLELAVAGVFDVIVHGCNCQCAMGAGIARAIRERFPEAFEADLATIPGDRGKLGSVSTAEVVRGSSRFVVVNAYTQFHHGGAGVKVDYGAIAAAFRRIKQGFAGRRIGYPLIGAGLGGGDWKRIAAIVDEELAGEDHTLVQFAPGPTMG